MRCATCYHYYAYSTRRSLWVAQLAGNYMSTSWRERGQIRVKAIDFIDRYLRKLDSWAAEFGRHCRILSVSRKSAEKNSARPTMALPRRRRKKSRPSSLMPNWWSLPHKIIVLYIVDLTNNLKQPRAFVTQIVFLHISSGLLCAMHYFYGHPIEYDIHYIFALWFLLLSISFFFPRLISAVAVWGTPANFNGFRVWQRYCTASSRGRQPNFATLNTGRHLCSAGRPSRWALAHILVCVYFYDYVSRCFLPFRQ